MPMIDVKDLGKDFGDVTAVDNLSFHVDEGEIFGFLGPNGAGKTTTIRMLCCLISKTRGEAKIAGLNTAGDADSLRIRKMVGLVPDNVGLYEELSAYENLEFYAKLYECPAPERKRNIERFLRMMDLWDGRERLAGEFSKGMKQKLALARALVHDPRLLFLDEPTANLDPESSKVVRELILQLKQQGKTVFLNTHNLEEAQRICDRIGILSTRLLAVDTPENLMQAAGGRRTVFELARVDDAILAAVRALEPKNVTVEGANLVVDVKNPATENPALVRAIVAAGGDVRFVTERSPGLEDTYLQIVKETR